jgi:hypothetical protein
VAFPQLTGTDPNQEQRHADHEEKEKKATAPCLGTAAT